MARRKTKRRPRWGGKRKGAGAPRGNLNALRHGKYSQQVREVRDVLALPRIRRIPPSDWE